MCGQYYIAEEDRQEFLALMAEVKRKSERMHIKAVTSGLIRPNDYAAVLATNARNRSIGVFPMRWGFKHPQKGFFIINARSETADSSSIFADSAKNRRCLVPASGYYEWKVQNDKKLRYAFHSTSGEPLYMAGLYVWQPDQKLPCYTLLTMDAPSALAGTHCRMPVLLPRSDAEAWLSSGVDDASYASVDEALRALRPIALCAQISNAAS